MELGVLLKKIALNQNLTPLELDFIENIGRETQLRNSQVAGWSLVGQTKLNIEFPFAPIYSEILASDKASISIRIPGNYNHLLILSSGRSTVASIDSSLCMQINGDTGNNYIAEFLYGLEDTPGASHNYAIDHLIIGGLAGTTASASKTESGFCLIPNIKSSLYKVSIALLSGLGTDATYAASLRACNWNNTGKITSGLIYSSSGNILSGSIVSVFGII